MGCFFKSKTDPNYHKFNECPTESESNYNNIGDNRNYGGRNSGRGGSGYSNRGKYNEGARNNGQNGGRFNGEGRKRQYQNAEMSRPSWKKPWAPMVPARPPPQGNISAMKEDWSLMDELVEQEQGLQCQEDQDYQDYEDNGYNHNEDDSEEYYPQGKIRMMRGTADTMWKRKIDSTSEQIKSGTKRVSLRDENLSLQEQQNELDVQYKVEEVKDNPSHEVHIDLQQHNCVTDGYQFNTLPHQRHISKVQIMDETKINKMIPTRSLAEQFAEHRFIHRWLKLIPGEREPQEPIISIDDEIDPRSIHHYGNGIPQVVIDCPSDADMAGSPKLRAKHQHDLAISRGNEEYITNWIPEHQTDEHTNNIITYEDFEIQQQREQMISPGSHSSFSTNGNNKINTISIFKKLLDQSCDDEIPLKDTDVLMDSGANMSACPPSIVEKLQLKVMRWKYAKRVEFGNHSVDYSDKYVYLGPFLGNTAIIPSITIIFASVTRANLKGYAVEMGYDLVCRIRARGHTDVVCTANLRESDLLYYGDIYDIVKIPQTIDPVITSNTLQKRSISNIDHGETETNAMINTVKLNDIQQNYRTIKATRRVNKEEQAYILALHNRMNHCAPSTMAKTLRSGAWYGIPEDITAAKVEQVFGTKDCPTCALTRAQRLPRTTGSGNKSICLQIGNTISCDYVPVSIPARGGFKGYYLFREMLVGYIMAILVTSKLHFYNAVITVKAFFAQFGHHLKVLMVDAGTVENAVQTKMKLNLIGISVQAASPEAQNQNPVERTQQTVALAVTAALCSQSALDNSCWGLALIHCIAVLNATPNTLSGDYSPTYAVTGSHPDLKKTFIFPFGQAVVVTKLNQQLSSFRFDPRGEIGYVVGYTFTVNGGCLVLLPNHTGTKQIFIRRDVQMLKLYEQPALSTQPQHSYVEMAGTQEPTLVFPQNPRLDMPALRIYTSPSHSTNLMENNNTHDNFSYQDINTSVDAIDRSMSSETTPLLDAQVENNITQERSSENVTLYDNGDQTTEDLSQSTSNKEIDMDVVEIQQQQDHTKVNTEELQGDQNFKKTKSGRIIKPPNKLLKIIHKNMETNPTLTQAINGPHWTSVWQPAIKKEMDTLNEMNTFIKVMPEDIPQDAELYPTKFVLTKKENPITNMFSDPKARLCVIGNAVAIYFQNIFAPTSNDKSLKLFFILAIALGLIINAIDIRGAFLYPAQKRDVYIMFPPKLTKGEPQYAKLLKTLYGLPNSPQAFYDDISIYLLENGYKRTDGDPCSFYLGSPGGKYLMTVIHVDDFLVAGESIETVNEFVEIVQRRYTIKRTMEVEKFLGIKIQHLSNNRVRLSQPQRINEMMDTYQLHDIPFPTVPMPATFSDDYQNDAPPCDYSIFMALLGLLMFIVKTRPDIAYSVHRMATRAMQATTRDFSSLLRIVSYLGGTRDLGVTFVKGMKSKSMEFITRLIAWVDAAYATHMDSKSHTGYCFSLGFLGAMFYCKSSKQSIVTLSSTEAEIVAGVECVKEVIWLRNQLAQLGFPQLQPTVIFADNSSMITLASDFSGNHKRVKHYLNRINFLMEQVRARIVEFKKVPGPENTSDMFTKPLGPVDFLHHRLNVLGNQSETDSQSI